MKRSLVGRSVGYAGVASSIRKIKQAKDDTVQANARKHLAQRMEKLRGLPQKIGQIMSMSVDELAAEPFKDLASSAQPLSFDEVEPILIEHWGGPISTVCQAIDPIGLAASLGQVHKAKLLDGREAAVKVAYPGIKDAVETDLKMLGWLSAPMGDLRRGFSLADYRTEIVRDLHEELDYRLEVEHQLSFRRVSDTVPGLVVPEPITKLCCETVLTSEWEDGQHIDDVVDWPDKAKVTLARTILRVFLTTLFDHGLVHGDPHPGNYRFRIEANGQPSVVLYDYGSVLQLSVRERLLILKLLQESGTKQGEPIGIFRELGFNEQLLDPIRAKIPALCSVLFEPFGQPAKFDLTTWQRSERIDDILGDDRWNFRMAGPAKLILLMRAFRGVLYYLERLGAPVSWERLLSPIVAKHSNALTKLDIPPSKSTDDSFTSLAQYLRIEVIRDGVQKVSLTMGMSAIEDLDTIIDDDVKERITQQGTNLNEIVRLARQAGYAPSELFTLDQPEKNQQIHVWIE